MLSCTYGPDIVRHSDVLEVLRAALDNIDDGIILLDAQFNAAFMNRAVRKLWGVSDEQAERKPPYSELVNDARITKAYGVPTDQLDAFIAQRIASVRAGDPGPVDLKVSDGRTVRSRCRVLPGGGRMLTYTDVTDLTKNAEEFERLAATDCTTDVYNRRHFMKVAEAEWQRFQRYHRPLSLLIFDVDRFKLINDRFGHDFGDRAIAHVCELCKTAKRHPDMLARIGGDEFAMLLPETECAHAELTAERLRQVVQNTPLPNSRNLALTISIGVAEATLSQSGFGALMKTADDALYKAKSNGRNQIASAGLGRASGYGIAAE